MSDLRITLNVEAEKLYTKEIPTKKDIIEACSLQVSAQHKNKDQVNNILCGNKGGDKIEDKELKKEAIIVHPDDRVEWKGRSVQDGKIGETYAPRNRNYRISIDLVSFNFEGENYFESNVLWGKGRKRKRVIADVENLPPEREDYNYTIYFTIHSPNGWDKSFHIDPKLRIKTNY